MYVICTVSLHYAATPTAVKFQSS